MNKSFPFANVLIEWYHLNKRDLPWRQTTDPYRIWVSEVILQQTRVSQGIDYYESFLTQFPDVFSLASANLDDVLRLWQGLGYYSRAANMHNTAKYIAFNLGGKFPDKYEELLMLDGIGDYTAAAISSFAFERHQPVCDGNVLRVISRVFAIQNAINTAKAKTIVKEILMNLLPAKNSSIFNQAIMEFGALHCKPNNPSCFDCVFNSICLAHAQNKMTEFPVKSIKTSVQNLFIDFLFLIDNNEDFTIYRRSEKGIWRNLFTFPYIENQESFGFDIVEAKAREYFIGNPSYIRSTEIIIHKLSHRRISARFHVFKGFEFKSAPGLKRISRDSVDQFGFPQLIVNQFEWLMAHLTK